jgi:hypothetical protein
MLLLVKRSTLDMLAVQPQFVPVSTREEWLDRHLERLCTTLELTATQFKDAESKYQAVGKWLSAPESSLATFAPVVYPQGSMLLGTTVRPWRGLEYDLDLVCQLHWCSNQPPLVVYGWVGDRLASNETYRQMLEKLKRCFRLSYAGDFHLDILPACPNSSLRNGCIIVPDRKLECWKHSNPKGFAAWFFEKCQLRDEEARRTLMKAVQPLPSPVPSEYKYPLQRVVQLMKRHRDVSFDGGRDIARSVILTTLAGYSYGGQRSLSRALEAILDRVHFAMAGVIGVPRIENPVHSGENFADTWDEAKFEQFKQYVGNFRRELKMLLNQPEDEERTGLQKSTTRLGGLFGSDEVRKAISLEAKELNEMRHSKGLAVTALGGITSAGSRGATTVQPNHFFGR